MAASEPSPVSDESSSGGTHLHGLVNETIAHDHPTAMSPRSALLAHTSLRGHSTEELADAIIEPSRTRKRTSVSERRRKRGRDLANASPSQRELVRLLIDQEHETSILRKQLYVANKQVDAEARRAAELERANQLAVQRYRDINESRVVVQQEASKAIQDSRIYHLELENAQKEIQRARESLKRIERERDEAEAAAARARTKARKLREQQIVAAAREEGRRLGFEAGFEHARQERLLVASRKPHSTAYSRTPRSSSRSVVTKLHFPAGNTSHQRSIPTLDPQEEEEAEAALQSPRPLDDLDTSSEISVSDLPIRNLPPMNPSANTSAVSTKLPRTSPLRPFLPPPESTYESRSHTPSPPSPNRPPPSISAQEPPPQLASPSPSIQYYQVEIPPQEEPPHEHLLTREELMREFNTKEDPNDIIKVMPRDRWVTATKHREMRGSPPALYPGPQPPPLLPQSNNARLARPPVKAIRFPSLAKTKKKAVSWYRSLSFAKKNKPVIDPADEENKETTMPTSAIDNKGKGKAPESSFASTDSDVQYGVPLKPPQSWYKKSAPSSIYTADAKYRPISGVESSPGLSQLELLFTPHVGAQSVRSGKEGKKLKEKDSQLSIIKEETPTSDRFLTDAMRASSSRMTPSSSTPRPNFIVQQRPSYEVLGSNSSPVKRRHPLSIVVPDPDEPLPVAAVAYSQPGPSKLQLHNNSLSQEALPSSTRTTNDTSIGIEIVPPSGFPPDLTPSPSHTEQNRLSPYHVYRPPSQPSSSRIIPMPSVTSFRNPGANKHLPPPPPIESRSGSRASSRRTDNKGFDPTMAHSPASRPQSALNNPMASRPFDDTRSSRSRTPRAHTPTTLLPQASPKPESVRSSASKKQPSALNLSASQTNLVVGQQQKPLPPPSSSVLSLVPPVRHSTSRVSLREAGSFANGFDETTYLDPAFYPGDGPAPGASQSALNLVTPIRHSTSPVSLRKAGSFSNGFDEGAYLDPAFYPGDRPDGHHSQVALNSNVPSKPVSRRTSSVLSYV